jgi:hypothetical protein
VATGGGTYGFGPDYGTMQNIARWGGGRYYQDVRLPDFSLRPSYSVEHPVDNVPLWCYLQGAEPVSLMPWMLRTAA